VKKNYESRGQEPPEHLGAREMAMVNRTIDLLEKERFGPQEDRTLAQYAAQVNLSDCSF